MGSSRPGNVGGKRGKSSSRRNKWRLAFISAAAGMDVVALILNESESERREFADFVHYSQESSNMKILSRFLLYFSAYITKN